MSVPNYCVLYIDINLTYFDDVLFLKGFYVWTKAEVWQANCPVYPYVYSVYYYIYIKYII